MTNKSKIGPASIDGPDPNQVLVVSRVDPEGSNGGTTIYARTLVVSQSDDGSMNLTIQADSLDDPGNVSGAGMDLDEDAVIALGMVLTGWLDGRQKNSSSAVSEATE